MQSILFVCKANVGRSQAAMELYRKNGGHADSAGTIVDEPGTTLSQRPGAATIIGVMREDYAINMKNNIRTQITEAIARPYDTIVVMAQPDTIPEWLQQDSRTVLWDVEDAKGLPVAQTRRIVHEIADRVDGLFTT